MELIDYSIKWLTAMFIAFALTVIDFFSRENGERYQNELRIFFY